jgi:hypothetical protein
MKLTCNATRRVKPQHVLHEVNRSRPHIWKLSVQRLFRIPRQLSHISSCIVASQEAQVVVLRRPNELQFKANDVKEKTSVIKTNIVQLVCNLRKITSVMRRSCWT